MHVDQFFLTNIYFGIPLLWAFTKIFRKILRGTYLPYVVIVNAGLLHDIVQN